MSTIDLPYIRCTCNRPIGRLWFRYQDMLKRGISIAEALDKLGLHDYCCRMRMMNPIKVVAGPPGSEYGQIVPETSSKDIKEVEKIKEMSEKMQSLSLSPNKPKEIVAPLESMKQSPAVPALPGMPALPGVPALGPVPSVTSAGTTSTGLTLAPVTQVDLPKIPSSEGSIASEQKKKVVRFYTAW